MIIRLIPLMHQWHVAYLQKAPFRCISDNNNSSLFSSNYWQITTMTNILIPLMRQWYAAHLQKTPFRCISDNSNSNFFSSNCWQITTMTNILIPLVRQWYAAHLQKTPLRCISDNNNSNLFSSNYRQCLPWEGPIWMHQWQPHPETNPWQQSGDPSACPPPPVLCEAWPAAS